MKELTLVYLVDTSKICLALKKRGFGAGNYNGYGGKLEEGETVLQGAVREVYEESLVRIEESALKKVADITFHFLDHSMRVHTYFVDTWEGEPQETEEMKPFWFLLEDIPYEKMWADDIHWMPRVFAGEHLAGEVTFKEDGKTIDTMQWNTVTSF